MPQQFSNNARSTLTSTITDVATSLTIQAGAADLFPAANVGSSSVPSANNWFKATLQDVNGNVEIVYVRTRTAGSPVFSNVMRGQEGTTARAFIAGSIVGLRVTAADLQDALDLPTKDSTFTGDNTFSGDNTFNGDLTGDVTGNVTGNLTGNVTGDLTGDVILGSGTLTTTNWTVVETSTKLLFKYQGTTVFSVAANGAVVSANDVSAFGTP